MDSQRNLAHNKSEGSFRCFGTHIHRLILMTNCSGPNLYPQLTNILISFRQHKIGMTAYIGEMFREIALADKKKDVQWYLVTSKDGQIADWRMTRLTFGDTSHFLATQVLHLVTKHHGKKFAKAAGIILSQLYVNDCALVQKL